MAYFIKFYILDINQGNFYVIASFLSQQSQFSTYNLLFVVHKSKLLFTSRMKHENVLDFNLIQYTTI